MSQDTKLQRLNLSLWHGQASLFTTEVKLSDRSLTATQRLTLLAERDGLQRVVAAQQTARDLEWARVEGLVGPVR